MRELSYFGKFQLLLWKNWILQWSQKRLIILQILMPIAFMCLLIYLRVMVTPEEEQEKRYKPFQVTQLAPVFNLLEIARQLINADTTATRQVSSGVGMQSSLKTPKKELFYAPKNVHLDELMRKVTTILRLSPATGFDNAEALEKGIARHNAFAGIQFEQSYKDMKTWPDKFVFKIRFPAQLRTTVFATQLTWVTNRIYPQYMPHSARNGEWLNGGVPPGYGSEGFLILQNTIGRAYIQERSGAEFSMVESTMQRFPYPAHLSDALLGGLESFLGLIILLAFIFPCTTLTKYITGEKETQLKEIMKIMGLNGWIHWLAWFAKSMMLFIVLSILVCVLLTCKWSDDVAIFTYSGFMPIFTFFIVYCIASTCFCFMLAVFFSKASTAAAATGVIWFVTFIPYSFTAFNYDNMSLAAKLAWSLICNTAMGFATKLILQFEKDGIGLQWHNIFHPVSIHDTLTVGDIMIMMLISALIYMLICLYVEQVLPGDYGVGKPWYFIFSTDYWCGSSDDSDDSDDYTSSSRSTLSSYGSNDSRRSHESYDSYDSHDLHERHERHAATAASGDAETKFGFEPEPKGKRAGVIVTNLRKKFGDKEVVKGVTLNMYENDITVLLGHNGAGKTTTICMLTGMFPPTSGTALINGHDIRTDMDGARLSLGICPQHNVLFDHMSVRNHIVFYSRLKGLSKDEVEKEVEKYLKITELEASANMQTIKLSGGLKRKLSLCCALCGRTKVVLCDEPSSGMDPAARRQLWDLIQGEKEGRTILLTTHFMDEADVLGDRIAIMAGGEVKSIGTSFFLKKAYGSGYRLICAKGPNCDVPAVTELIRTYIPGIEPTSDVGSELTYHLSDEYVKKFPKIFKALQKNADNLGLESYGVGVTSLEDVFMKVGAEADVGADDDEHGRPGKSNPQRFIEENSRLLTGFELMRYQCKAMFIKHLGYLKRRKILFLIMILVPIALLLLTVLIAEQSDVGDMPPLVLEPDLYPKGYYLLSEDVTYPSNTFNGKFVKNYQKLVEEYGSNYHFVNIKSDKVDDYLLRMGNSGKQPKIDWEYIGSVAIAGNGVTVAFNNQPYHTAPIALGLFINAWARSVINDKVKITVINHPLPSSAGLKLEQVKDEANFGVDLALHACFAMCFVTSFYILFLIKERESRAKLLQFVGGVNVWIFWLAQFLWNLFTFFIISLAFVIVLAICQRAGFSTFDEISRVFIVFLIFAIGALPIVYAVSFFIDEPANGFALIAIVNILLGEALFIVVLMLQFDMVDKKDIADTLKSIFIFYPHFAFAFSLYKLFVNAIQQNACHDDAIKALSDKMRCQYVPDCCVDYDFFGWKDPGILQEILAMLFVGCTVMICIIIMEHGCVQAIFAKLHRLRYAGSSNSSRQSQIKLDDDVKAEQEHIDKMSQEDVKQNTLVLNRVSKYYGNLIAVEQISMCVKPKECFGLLGVNGAGKSTIFKMMTGDAYISKGIVYVQGLDLSKHKEHIFKDIGYCPQNNAVLEDLSGRETLEIFCLLRGIHPNQIQDVSEELATAFGFIRHIDKPSRVYSGGNKRKLSAAVSVIGSPAVIYLDDPTAGMDPASRRQLWGMVCLVRDSGKSIVLTSQSMEECEALCTRLAIMVNGEFRCMGGIQHLKSKFSKGFVLKIMHRQTDGDNNVKHRTSKEILADSAKIKEFVTKSFKNSELKEEYEGILTFYVPATDIDWAYVFGFMESNKSIYNIEDYSINQTSLEEIFLEFASEQQHNLRKLKDEKRTICFCIPYPKKES